MHDSEARDMSEMSWLWNNIFRMLWDGIGGLFVDEFCVMLRCCR